MKDTILSEEELKIFAENIPKAWEAIWIAEMLEYESNGLDTETEMNKLLHKYRPEEIKHDLKQYVADKYDIDYDDAEQYIESNLLSR
jgi:hypothetical protein